MRTLQKTKLGLALLTLTLGLSFASCKKGDTGAAGKDGKGRRKVVA